ncbi:hypothetical protein Tco_0355555 [Tanacetum coccineum]
MLDKPRSKSAIFEIEIYKDRVCGSAGAVRFVRGDGGGSLCDGGKVCGVRFQLDEQWFTLNSDLLRDALEITPVDPANPFVSPPAGEIIMDFVNELGYPEAIHFVSHMHVNNLYQPWRAILSLINQTNVDYAELLWEEFVQGIQTFFTHRDSNKIPSKKPTPHVIPYCRFTKLIIYYLGSKYNIHKRPESPRHVTGDDFLLAIQRSEYYKQYVEMAARKVQAKEGGKKKTAPKADKPVKPAPAKQSKPATAKQPKPKPVKEKSTKPTPLQKAGKGKVTKVRNVKSSLQLVDEHDEEQAQPKPEPQGAGEEYDVERAIQMSLELFQAQGQAHVGSVAIREPVAEAIRPLLVVKVTEEASTGPSAQPEDDASANITLDTPSPTDAETGVDTDKTNSEGDTEILNIGGEQGEDVANKEDLEGKTAEINEGQAGSDPGISSSMTTQQKRIREKQIWKLKSNPWSPFQFIKHLPQFLYCPRHSSVLDLASRVSALEQVCANYEKRHKLQDNTVQGLSSRVFTLELRDLPHKIDETVHEAVKEAVQIELQAPLKECFRDMSEAYMKEILHDRMFESGTYRSQPEHVALYEALEESMERDNRDEFLTEKDKSRKRRRDEQDPPPPLPDSDLNKKKRHNSDASGLKQPPAPPSSAWKMSDTREAFSSSSKQKSVPHSEQLVEEVPVPDDAVPSNDLPQPENNWANAFATSYKDPEEDKLLQKTSDMGSFIKWFCRQLGKSKLSKADLEGPAYKVVRAFHSNSISLQFQMVECHLLLTDEIDLVNLEGHRVVLDISKPLPLRGPPGQVTIQPQLFFNKDLEYLVLCNKERRSALSISKLKEANYPDFRLKELVPLLWIESERDYDISDAYGISHWWFKRKEFYIIRHSAPFDRSTVRSYMRILSVLSLKTISRYGYTYMKEIVLRIADYKEYKISEFDFKNLHLNDFEDLYLLHLQGKINHLPRSKKVHMFNAINMWIRNLVIRKTEDYIVSKPRAIIYRDMNDQKKMMRETEVHKFSDGTLNRILDKLDHMVKDFKLFKYNPGMETRMWSEDDRRRSKEFMEVIKARLKTRRIFRSPESFVSGRLRDVDYRLIQRTE